MKKLFFLRSNEFVLSTFLIIVFTFYVIYQRLSVSTSALREPAVVNDNTSQTTISSPPTPIPSVIPAPQKSNAGFRDGNYTGDTVDAYYGNVQVKVIISGGNITDVKFLQYPSDRRTSVMINTQAMPYLKQEAIQAQNANVDIISGATATSQAFRQSLRSALLKA